MNRSDLPHIELELADLPTDRREHHEVMVDSFGRFFFWLRNRSLGASRRLTECDDERDKLAALRRSAYDRVARMDVEEREAALMLAQETVDGFCQQFLWFMANRGVDQRFGSRHAYRFQISMEIVDVETNEVVESDVVSTGGKKFFGDYWGRWLNRYSVGSCSKKQNGAEGSAKSELGDTQNSPRQ